MDGSTDSSVKEKELAYIMFVGIDGRTKCSFLFIADATASGLKSLLEISFLDLGIDDWKQRLVSMCVDGAAVNLGVRRGLATILREEVPWLIAIHCLNHRLELAAKNAFSKTYMEDVSQMLMDMYYVYEKSCKRLRELKELANAMEEAVRKPEKAGTRWLQHKSRALRSLIIGYSVIYHHSESMASEQSSAKLSLYSIL